MAQLDPSIILSGAQPVNAMQLLQAQLGGQQLRQHEQQLAHGDLQMQEQQHEMEGQNALRQIYAQGGIDAQTGLPRDANALAAIGQHSPKTVAALVQQAQARMVQLQTLATAKANENKHIADTMEAKIKIARDADQKTLDAYDAALAAGYGPEGALESAKRAQVATYDELKKGGNAVGITQPPDLNIDLIRRNVLTVDQREKQREFNAKSPTMRTRIVGENEVQEQWNPQTRTWEQLGTGPRFARQVAPVINVGSGLEPMGQDELDYAATLYRRTGIMPSMGQGTAGAKNRQAIIKIAAAQAKAEGGGAAEDITTQRGIKADTASLTAVQKMSDAVESFTNTASANGKVLVDLSKKVDTTGVPVIERWVRAGKKAVAGDPDVTAFNAQLLLYGNEIAKIATNPNLTGVLTVEAQREMSNILDRGSTPQQIERLVSLLDADAKRRKTAVQDQLKEIKVRIGGKKTAETGTTERGTQDNPIAVTTEDEALALPSGTWILPPGRSKPVRKP